MKSKFLKNMVVSVTASLIATFAVEEIKASSGNITEVPDYLLILGYTLHGDKPCEMLNSRIVAAANFLKSHQSVKAIPCGGIVQDDQLISEAEAIKRGLVELGIDEDRIILEDKSKTTVENFQNAKKIIDEREGGKKVKIAFLSNEYHLLRSSIIAKRAGIVAETIPAHTNKKDILKAYLREFIVFPSVLSNGKN